MAAGESAAARAFLRTWGFGSVAARMVALGDWKERRRGTENPVSTFHSRGWSVRGLGRGRFGAEGEPFKA